MKDKIRLFAFDTKQSWYREPRLNQKFYIKPVKQAVSASSVLASIWYVQQGPSRTPQLPSIQAQFRKSVSIMFVFCGGMFRSGSTLQYQIASHLIEKRDIGKRITWHNPAQFPEIKKLYGDTDHFVVFKAHKLTDELRTEVESGNARVITVHRDIRDVVVSAMKKNRWSFRKIWRDDRLKYWTSRFDQWAQQPQALVCRYDQMIDSLPSTVAAIAAHLGIEISNNESHAVAEHYNLERQR